MFASRDLREGEVIDRCPALLLPITSSTGSLFDHRIGDYVFAWEPGQSCALVLGAISLVNNGHGHSVNTYVTFSMNGPTATLIADRDIAAREELLHNYSATPTGTPRSLQG